METPDHARQIRILEALLFAAAEPLSEAQLASHLPAGAECRELLLALQEFYAARGVNLCRVGDGWAFRTAPDLASFLTVRQEFPQKLSRAASETLAIIAYHQPLTRTEIENVRGVSLSRGTLDTLLELDWIKPRGRRRAPGRPVTWGTTSAFLDHFGLAELGDLPGMDELKAAGFLDPLAGGPVIDEGHGRPDDDAGDGGNVFDAPDDDDPEAPVDDDAHDPDHGQLQG